MYAREHVRISSGRTCPHTHAHTHVKVCNPRILVHALTQEERLDGEEIEMRGTKIVCRSGSPTITSSLKQVRVRVCVCVRVCLRVCVCARACVELCVTHIVHMRK